MKNNVVLLLAAGAALLLMRRPTTGSTLGPIAAGGGAAPAQNYINPVALAASAASQVIAMLTGRPATGTPGDTANPEAARNAVRFGDSYYGAGAFAWGSGNAEAARAAVRAGDPYYVTQWQVPAAEQGAGGAGFLSDDVAAALYGDQFGGGA